jgi:hypothetical protein
LLVAVLCPKDSITNGSSRQITSTTTIMALSEDAADFDQKFHTIHAKRIPEKKPLALKAGKAPPSLPLFPTAPLIRRV